MALPQASMTLDDFMAWEDAQPERHELVAGVVTARAGRRRTHGRTVLNLVRRLGNLLEGTPCQVFAESMKLQVADDTLLYPDVFVTCDKADLATEMVFRAPVLVIEVLSPSTQGDDRSGKFALYRRLPSLQEYLLVDPETRRVEGFRRQPSGDWVFADMSDGGPLASTSLGLQVPLAQVFDGVDPAG